jgi:hypothetical protein
MPYLPTVKAIAPSTPIGASFMMMPMTLNSTCVSVSMKFATGAPRSPSSESAAAEQHREQQHLQHVAVGEGATTVVGISFIRKSTLPPPTWSAFSV